MFRNAFKKIEHGAAARIIDQINPLLDGAKLDSANSQILSHPLSFYPDYDYIEIENLQVYPARIIRVLGHANKDFVFLDGTNQQIYDLNNSVPILLNDDTVHLYVRFFFYVVKPKNSPIQIIDSVNDIEWSVVPSLKAKNALGKMIMPLHQIDRPNSDLFELKASVLFRDALFDFTIIVHPQGRIEVTKQDIVVEDIPVKNPIFDHF